jgi:hypothetical protein
MPLSTRSASVRRFAPPMTRPAQRTSFQWSHCGLQLLAAWSHAMTAVRKSRDKAPMCSRARSHTVRLAVVLHEFPHDAVNLHGELACRRDDDHPCAVSRLELCAVQQLDAGDEECLHGKGTVCFNKVQWYATLAGTSETAGVRSDNKLCNCQHPGESPGFCQSQSWQHPAHRAPAATAGWCAPAPVACT